MLTEFTTWLFDLVKLVFTTLWTFLSDGFIYCVGLIVNGFAALVASIPVPGFIAGGLQSLWGSMDSGIVYVSSQVGVPEALGIVAAGIAFRLLRKFATLFQW